MTTNALKNIAAFGTLYLALFAVSNLSLLVNTIG